MNHRRRSIYTLKPKTQWSLSTVLPRAPWLTFSLRYMLPCASSYNATGRESCATPAGERWWGMSCFLHKFLGFQPKTVPGCWFSQLSILYCDGTVATKHCDTGNWSFYSGYRFKAGVFGLPNTLRKAGYPLHPCCLYAESQLTGQRSSRLWQLDFWAQGFLKHDLHTNTAISHRGCGRYLQQWQKKLRDKYFSICYVRCLRVSKQHRERHGGIFDQILIFEWNILTSSAILFAGTTNGLKAKNCSGLGVGVLDYIQWHAKIKNNVFSQKKSREKMFQWIPSPVCVHDKRQNNSELNFYWKY